MSEKRHKQYRKVKRAAMMQFIRDGLRGGKLTRKMTETFPRFYKSGIIRLIRAGKLNHLLAD